MEFGRGAQFHLMVLYENSLYHGFNEYWYVHIHSHNNTHKAETVSVLAECNYVHQHTKVLIGIA